MSMLERYMCQIGIDPTSELFLFRDIVRIKKRKKLRPSGSLIKLFYHEGLVLEETDLGHSSVGFGLHSFHAGGASATAKDGVLDCLFKQHGRWKSYTAKDGYVEDSVENQLSVIRSIGI